MSGTMARTAFALGAAGLIALKGTADLANSKVLRGSMGALFRLPPVMTRRCRVSRVVQSVQARSSCVADPAGTDVGQYRRATRQRRMALVVGNEGAGVRPELAAVARRQCQPFRCRSAPSR